MNTINGIQQCRILTWTNGQVQTHDYYNLHSYAVRVCNELNVPAWVQTMPDQKTVHRNRVKAVIPDRVPEWLIRQRVFREPRIKFLINPDLPYVRFSMPELVYLQSNLRIEVQDL